MGIGPDAMTILAFDCAGGSCAVVLWRAGRTLARRFETTTHGQAERLVPMIRAALDDAGAGFGDLDAIATTVGPGSFTGLRAGLATARGLALATGLRCYGHTTFAVAAGAVSAAERRDRVVVAAVDTRRDDLFVQTYTSALVERGAAAVLRPNDAAQMLKNMPAVLTGDATAALADALRDVGADFTVAAKAGPFDAETLALLAAERLAAAAPSDALRPLYLRAPDITPSPSRR